MDFKKNKLKIMKKKIMSESEWKEMEVEFDDLQVKLAEKIYESILPPDRFDNVISNEKNSMTELIFSEDQKRIIMGYFPKHQNRTEVEIKGPKYIITVEKKW